MANAASMAKEAFRSGKVVEESEPGSNILRFPGGLSRLKQPLPHRHGPLGRWKGEVCPRSASSQSRRFRTASNALNSR